MATIVISGFSSTSLGIVRCLAKAKAEIIVIGPNSSKDEMPLFYSNIPNRKILIKDHVSFVQALLDFASTHSEKPHLMLADDRYVMEVSENREEIQSHYKLQLPSRSLLANTMAKDRFHTLALDMNLTVPTSVRVASRDALDIVAEQLGFPVVIKPYLLHSQKVNNQLELEEFVSNFSETNWISVVAEQWIPGGDNHLFFCFAYFDRESKPIAWVTGQKLRQWRPHYGTTSLCTTVRNDYVLDETIRIFTELGYVGFGSIEYKYHQEEDTYYIMEPTVGRYDQQITLTEAAGVNLPLVDFKYLSGCVVQSQIQKNEIWWIHELSDLASRFHRRQTVKNSFTRYLAAADTHVLFAWNDPLPLLTTCAFKILRILNRIKFASARSIRMRKS